MLLHTITCAHIYNLNLTFRLIRLCRQNKVKACLWSHSPTDLQTIIVSGDGVQRIKESFNLSAVNKGNFKYEFVDCQHLTLPLSGRITTENPDGLVQSTTELLVYTNNGPADTPRSVYAACSAHAFMSESEKATLDTGRLPVCDQQKILQQVRHRCLGGQLTGPAGDQSSLKVNVDGQPLLAYRPQEYPGKPFMTDIALIRIPPDVAARFMHFQNLTDRCRFNGITTKAPPALDAMIGIPIKAKRRSAIVVPSSVSLEPGFELGYHLAFTVEDG